MVNHLILGLQLLVAPSRAWRAINDETYSPLALAVYTGIFATLVFLFRTIGALLSGMGAPWFALEALLFTLICVGGALSIGLLLMPFGRLARHRINDGHAMKLALYSATPLWAFSVFQIIPSHMVRAFFLLGSLGYACFLLFLGLPRLFGTEPSHTLVISLIVSGVWILGLVLFTQLFLPVAFNL